jgi:hypothetical protein
MPNETASFCGEPQPAKPCSTNTWQNTHTTELSHGSIHLPPHTVTWLVTTVWEHIHHRLLIYRQAPILTQPDGRPATPSSCEETIPTKIVTGAAPISGRLGPTTYRCTVTPSWEPLSSADVTRPSCPGRTRTTSTNPADFRLATQLTLTWPTFTQSQYPAQIKKG